MTSVEHREPTAMSASGGRDMGRCGDVSAPRKHATSLDAACGREAKRTRSSWPLETLPTLSPPTLGMAG